MQTASILLALGGDAGNQVPKYGVTAAEIAVLRAIHGDEAVTDILPLDLDANRTNRAELARLRGIYGSAQDGEGNKVLDMLYPGAAARVFESLDELELPRELFATKERVSANFGGNGAAGGAAPTQATGLDAMKVPELKKLAEDKGIDLGDATKKAEIIAKLEAADAGPDDVEDEADEEVEDLPDSTGVLG